MADHGVTYWVVRGSACQCEFRDLIASRTHRVAVDFALELTAQALGARIDLDPRRFACDIIEGSSANGDGVVANGQRHPATVAFDLESSARPRLRGQCEFRPYGSPGATAALWVELRYDGQTLFSQLLRRQQLEEPTERTVLSDLLREEAIRRLRPGWRPLSFATARAARQHTNLAVDFDELAPAPRGDALNDLAYLAVREVRDLRRGDPDDDEGDMAVEIVRYRPGFPNETGATPETGAVDATAHAAHIDHYLNGEPRRDSKGDATATNTADEVCGLIRARLQDDLESDMTPARRVLVATYATEHSLTRIRPGEVGLGLFGFRSVLPENMRCAVDLGRLWSDEGLRRRLARLAPLPHYRNRQRDRVAAAWFTAPTRQSHAQSWLRPFETTIAGEAIAAGAAELAAAAESSRYSGFFVWSDGSTATTWLSLADCEQALRRDRPAEIAPADLLQQACCALLEQTRSAFADYHEKDRRVSDTVGGDRRDERATATATTEDRPAAPRPFVVLNMCSPGSGVATEFRVLHVPSIWADGRSWKDNVGSISIKPSRVTIDQDNVRGLVQGGTECDVVLLVPFDTYDGHIGKVTSYVRETGNRLALIIPLISLANSQQREHAHEAEVIPLVRFENGSFRPLHELDDVRRLHPWVLP